MLVLIGLTHGVLWFLFLAETLKAFPEASVTYKEFGGEDELHYGHYDLLCARTVCSFPNLVPVYLSFFYSSLKEKF